MIQKTTTLSKSYQVTIPSAMRKVFKLEAGDTIEVVECREGILLKKALSREEKIKRVFEDLEEWRERLPSEAKDDISKTAGWTAK